MLGSELFLHSNVSPLPEHLGDWVSAYNMILDENNLDDILQHPPTPDIHFFLRYQEKEGLSFLYKNTEYTYFNNLHIDFLSGKASFLAQKQRVQHHPLAKTLGTRRQQRLHVIDATAGLGQDAWVFHLLNCKLTLIERHPISAMLLSDALYRAKLHDQIPLIWEDAKTYLETQSYSCADIIYLDPMFPEKKKSSKSKKGMDVFQAHIGYDNDSDKLLHIARQAASYRVIVKRPRLAAYIAQTNPNHSIFGQSTRFDIYLPYNH
jgi:16S rRNA (guanine1516-N2)-methyltransferase